MAMVKNGISFNNSVVDVIDGKQAGCENCNSRLNMLTSVSGVVVCDNCGHKNKVIEMENMNE